MKYIVNSQEMKEIDNYSIQKIGIPSLVLMERAALSVVEVLSKEIQKKDSILIVCGTGNNGADGIAVGRILYHLGFNVDILVVGDRAKGTQEFQTQLNISKNIGMNIFNQQDENEYNIVVDAIFGIGLSKDVTGIYKEIIEWMNATSAKIYSIDIPSGIHANTGKVMNIAVRADETITFGFHKVGNILYPGAEYAGKITLKDIGFPDKAREYTQPECFMYEEEDIKRLPQRANYSNKGTFGKVLVIAGSRNIAGACYLSAKAAYRMGAGIVQIFTANENREVLQTLLPEALITTYDKESFYKDSYVESVIHEIKTAASIIIGPGIGLEQEAKQLLVLVLEHGEVPTIIDADGINLLATEYPGKYKDLPKNYILTPHLKEMSRLMRCNVDIIRGELLSIAQEATTKCGYTLVLKDTRTIVACGESKYINTTGNNGMATGGSGDVLTGIIGALSAQGMEPFAAAALGVYIHGRAGDGEAFKKGLYSMIASDIIEALAETVTI